MAEFPDLGQNCSLSLCQVLDFTPYACTLCRKTYCSQHRFSHGCELASQNSIQQVGPSAPVNVFLCSFRDCSNSEAVKIVCDHCKSNFCLKHRDILDHKCEQAIRESTDRTEQVQKIREKLDLPQSTSQSQAPSTSVSTKKVLTDEEQKRADKIALMKLKSRFAKGNNFGSDALIVFVKWNDVREPVQLNKKWSIGKSVSEMISAVKAPQDSKARKSDIDSVLDFSLSTGDTLKEGDTICLCE